jgi:lipoyl(octanoyl) transferase
VTPVAITDLGCTQYTPVFQAMRDFTQARDASSPNQIWFTEHAPVFTQGQAGKPEHVLFPGDIPVVQSDRGGQVTYHGPGQLVGYLLLDLRAVGVSVRELVRGIERSMIEVLASYGVIAAARDDAPGVYVAGAKIGALGLRVRKGCSYHGLSLNIDMDLEPFQRINPCGLLDTAVTQLVDVAEASTLQGLRGDELMTQVQRQVLAALCDTYSLQLAD